MRVVAGSAGGLRLRAPRGLSVRPTSDRVREALFASLGSLGVVEGARVVDLFAGTGALGIEALSRGAAHATFVDSDPAAVAAIRDNLRHTGLEAAAEVVGGDVLAFLRGCRQTFDLALVDPPYAFGGWAELMPLVPATLAALESSEPVDPGPGWETLRARRYGGTVVTLARRP